MCEHETAKIKLMENVYMDLALCPKVCPQDIILINPINKSVFITNCPPPGDANG